jgi:hypothetical protein
MRTLAFLTFAFLLACGDDDGTTTDAGGTADAGGVDDAGGMDDAGGGDDAGPGDGGPDELCTPASFPPDPSACAAMPNDYSPGADDAWDACISDDGQYHSIEPTISTSARVMAFEDIGAMLFTPGADPSSDAFLMARMIYQESEGLDSRVVRRYDPHFTVPDGTDCTMAGVPSMYPGYCVGPARLQPLLLDALNQGIAGAEPRKNAARIEAALLWFLAISTYKESLTCTTTAKDCDSSYAYYTGGEAARCGIGLSRYVAEVDAYAHDRAWDGLLAVRCWRDLDSADVASDLAIRDGARRQYDRAVQDGVAAILSDRLEQLAATTDAERDYYYAFVQVLSVPVVEEMERRDNATEAATLSAEMDELDPAMVDTAAAIAAIDAVYDCP